MKAKFIHLAIGVSLCWCLPVGTLGQGEAASDFDDGTYPGVAGGGADASMS